MKLNRRSLLKLFGASRVVGKEIAQKVISDSQIMALGNAYSLSEGSTEGGVSENAMSSIARCENEIKYYANRLLSLEDEFVKDRDRLKYQQLVTLVRLDPDLAYNRSLSMAAKMRIQADRNVEREYQDSRMRMLNSLETYKEQLSKLLANTGEK